jgi:arsenate reductase (thioredoxin)
MPKMPYHVLFLCTGNSARSIIAEALLNSVAGDRFLAYSAGSHPTGKVNPLAVEELARLRIPTDGLRSKSWEEFAQPGAPVMDFVITVCDNAAGEVCPAWPGQPITAHWGMPDPAAVQGSDEVKRKAFHEVAVMMKRRIDIMRSLPLESLDRLAIQKQVRDVPNQ